MPPSEVHFHLTWWQVSVTGRQKCHPVYMLNEAMIMKEFSETFEGLKVCS